MTKTKKLTLSASMTALSFVLVMVSKVLPGPWAEGGGITLGSMVPIIVVSLILGTKWGLLSGFAFSLIQMITGFYLPPVTTFLSLVGVLFLDYVFAFSILGTADFFAKLMGNKIWAIPLSGTIVTGIRYIMHILSGLLIWGAFADTENVFWYALLYNGSYMIPEMIITTVVLSFFAPKLKK